LISPAPLSMAVFAASFAQAPVAVADTIVTVQASSTGLKYWVDLMVSISTIVIALALIAMAITVVPAAWYSRKVYGKVNDMVNRVREDFNPVMRHVSAVADNVDYVTTSLRNDVEHLNATVASANQRVNRVAAMAEQRVAELNALLQVVQEEAENLFIDTASTVRGVRVGADAFRRFRTEDGSFDDVAGSYRRREFDDVEGSYRDRDDDGEDGLDIDIVPRG